MKTRHIVQVLQHNHPTFSYSMKTKETLDIDIVIVSSVSFHAEVKISMEAQGGKVNVRCLVLPKNNAVITVLTHQIHMAPHAKSELLVKSLITDSSSVVFHGNVFIDRLAKKSDAYQKNSNVIIGDGGVMVASPTLEILNNDVKCTHGVTIGTIPKDAVWYMQTRGITEEQAKALYVHGFLHESMTYIQDKKIENLVYNEYQLPI